MSTGFRRFGTATTPSGSGMMIPRSGTSGGGEYGADITDDLRTFAVQREPVAHRVVFTVAHDIFDNWFTLEGSNYRNKTVASASTNEETSAFNRRIQKQLDKLNAKSELTRMAVFERAYGWSILALGFTDSIESLSEPAGKGELQEIKAYAPTQISRIQEDTDPTSPRYGLPLIYEVTRPGTVAPLKIHYTRTIHFATRLLDHDWRGKSTLDPIWDDLTVLRNIRWGMGQTMYRYGSGFPDITFTGAELSDIEDYISSGAFNSLNSRTYFVHSEDQTMEFKGLQGHALDPMNYYLPPMEHISCGTGIPLAILRGAQAGALTGSEVNQNEYYGLISDEQSGYEDGIRQLINLVVGQETDFTFNWTSGIEASEAEKQTVALQRAQELDILWNFYKRNEIRKMIDPEAAELTPEEGGDDLKTKTNGPQSMVNPLTGQPLNSAPFGAKPTLDDPNIKEQIEKGDASYVITEISAPRKPHAVSS